MTNLTQEQQTQKMMKFANSVKSKKEIVIAGTTYFVIKSSRYTVWVKGKKGAEYSICLCPKMQIIDFGCEYFAVFEMLDGCSRSRGFFAYDGNQATKVRV